MRTPRASRALALLLLLGTACDPDALVRDLVGGSAQATADPQARIEEMARALGLVAAGDGSFTYRGKGLVATVAPDGTVDFDGEHEGGFAGPADWEMRSDRKRGGASAELELLQATADLRREMSMLWYGDLIDSALASLDAELMSILEAHHLSMPERRALIFERWDGVEEVLESYAATTAESAVSDIHRLHAEGVKRARARIEAFVRHHLPAGTRDAYRNDELDQLNARRKSEAPFDPYEGQGVLG